MCLLFHCCVYFSLNRRIFTSEMPYNVIGKQINVICMFNSCQYFYNRSGFFFDKKLHTSARNLWYMSKINVIWLSLNPQQTVRWTTVKAGYWNRLSAIWECHCVALFRALAMRFLFCESTSYTLWLCIVALAISIHVRNSNLLKFKRFVLSALLGINM